MPFGGKAEILEMYTFLKSLHFTSLLAVVKIVYKFSTFVVITLQWNVTVNLLLEYGGELKSVLF